MAQNPALAVIIDALRTPRGRGNAKGALAGVKPVDLLAAPLSSLMDRHGLTFPLTDAVFGCVTQTAGQGANIGKLALIAAGFGDDVPGLTVNRFCASGLSALRIAAQAALADDGVAIAGGVESMSQVPMASDNGALTHDRDFQASAGLIPIGLAADAVATLEGFTRADLDGYAAESQARAARARANGRFASLVPVGGLKVDETPRPGTTAVALAAMVPAFAEMGEKWGIDARLAKRLGLPGIEHGHHAGNSPAMADGASVVLVATAAAAARAGLKPRARILATAEVSVDRVMALTGAVDASRAALKKCGLTAKDIDLFEVNESFAGLMMHYLRHMGIGADRLNVNGGAIALGHAMGSTGTALLGTALDELEARGARRALVSACGAAGLASAIVIERTG